MPIFLVNFINNLYFCFFNHDFSGGYFIFKYTISTYEGCTFGYDGTCIGSC